MAITIDLREVRLSKNDFATKMRGNPTEAEAVLQAAIKGGFHGYMFDAQVVLYGWIVDFYCNDLKLAIEVDGSFHEERKDYDSHRDSTLRKHKVRVIRFTNEEVLQYTSEVVGLIRAVVESRLGLGGPVVLRHIL